MFEVVTSNRDVLHDDGGLYQFPGEGSAEMEPEGGCSRTLCLATGICVLQAGEPRISVHLTSEITIPLG